MPKLTIITISYNTESCIENTIISVLNQKTDEVEYIIIDGKSKDGTMQIVEKYRDKIDVVVSEPDKGIADAFNKGIQRAKGELIGLINAGDALLPGAVQALLEHFDPQVDVFYGDCLVDDIDNNRQFVRPAMELEFMQYALPFSHQSCFVAKRAYEKYGCYSQEYKICMDYALLRKMHKEGAVFRYIPVALARFANDGVSYHHPVRTMKENMTIACQYGLPKVAATVYGIKHIVRHGLKKILEKLGLFQYVAKLKDARKAKR